jgi:hypothetical protein
MSLDKPSGKTCIRVEQNLNILQSSGYSNIYSCFTQFLRVNNRIRLLNREKSHKSELGFDHIYLPRKLKILHIPYSVISLVFMSEHSLTTVGTFSYHCRGCYAV